VIHPALDPANPIYEHELQIGRDSGVEFHVSPVLDDPGVFCRIDLILFNLIGAVVGWIPILDEDLGVHEC
jgi:hypothetical protein